MKQRSNFPQCERNAHFWCVLHFTGWCDLCFISNSKSRVYSSIQDHTVISRPRWRICPLLWRNILAMWRPFVAFLPHKWGCCLQAVHLDIGLNIRSWKPEFSCISLLSLIPEMHFTFDLYELNIKNCDIWPLCHTFCSLATAGHVRIMTLWQSNLLQNVGNAHVGIDHSWFNQGLEGQSQTMSSNSSPAMTPSLSEPLCYQTQGYAIYVRDHPVLSRSWLIVCKQWLWRPHPSLECWQMSESPNQYLSIKEPDVVPIHCGSVTPVTWLYGFPNWGPLPSGIGYSSFSGWTP